MSSLEGFDTIINLMGFIPFGSLVNDFTKKLHGEIRGTELGYLKNPTGLEAEIKGTAFATTLDLTDLASKMSNKSFVSKVITPISHGVTSYKLVEDLVKEDKIDDLVYRLLPVELMRAKDIGTLEKKYFLASTYIQTLINDGTLEYSFKRGKFEHSLNQKQIVNMYQDLINTFIEFDIFNK